MSLEKRQGIQHLEKLINIYSMKVKIKKLHEDAVIPQYATDGSAGMDLTVVSWEFDKCGNKVYHTGLAFEIPKGYAGFVFPRSSNAKKNLLLSNSVGIIDSDYRGEVTFKYKASVRVLSSLEDYAKVFSGKHLSEKENIDITSVFSNDDYKVGEKCGQIVIMPYPKIEFEEVSELSETSRGNGGYGSTGK